MRPALALEERSEPRWAAVSSLRSQRKGAFETGSGGEPGTSCCCPVAPLVASVMGNLSG